jgi:hypothetical protein
VRRIMANDNDNNTQADTSTYDTTSSVTNVSDVDALVMMPVAMITMLISSRLQPNHGNCAHSDVARDNDPDNDNDNDRIMIMIILVSGEEGGGRVRVTASGE